MTVDITFQIDASDGIENVSVRWPMDTVEQASNKLSDMMDRAGKSSNPFVKVRNVETDNYVFLHTMKICNIVVEKVDE